MKVIHGTWVPQAKSGFLQEGGFFIWIETVENIDSQKESIYSRALSEKALKECLIEELGLPSMYFFHSPFSEEHLNFSQIFFLLPSNSQRPLHSFEIVHCLGKSIPEEFSLEYQKVPCLRVFNILAFLREIYFKLKTEETKVALGQSLFFWRHYVESFQEIILKDQYIPSLKYHKKKASKEEDLITPSWEIISEDYEKNLEYYVDYMPHLCRAGFGKKTQSKALYKKDPLLRHFSENLLGYLIHTVPYPNVFKNKVIDTPLSKFMIPDFSGGRKLPSLGSIEECKQLEEWRHRVTRTIFHKTFRLAFQLEEPQIQGSSSSNNGKASHKKENEWKLNLFAMSQKESSFKRSLREYWDMKGQEKLNAKEMLGEDFERKLLLELGIANRIYPQLAPVLNTNEPSHCFLNKEEAYQFLREQSWVLQEAGYKVIIPSWYTPEARKKAKIQMRVRPAKKKTKNPKSYFSMESLINYDFEISLGSQKISLREWKTLMASGEKLIHFRGEWIELDPQKMKRMQRFLEKEALNGEINYADFIRMEARDEEGDFDFEYDKELEAIFSQLRDKSSFKLAPAPPSFKGELREYQKRGLSWLLYLESLCLNGCLADDMGLGKTVQVIAYLLYEELKNQRATTLLIAPNSVVGNWQKESMKFSPHLKVMIHHGIEREKKKDLFHKKAKNENLVITTYALAAKDKDILSSFAWDRIILDEAQNIKNPETKQARAIFSFKTERRLALTGTPLENNLLDIWSIFNFLHPGYLSNKNNFRRSFQIPIQKNNDQDKAKTLRRLVEPFLLRRLKTDKSIINDLPEKIEQKVYCNLTKEQASLYENVVKNIAENLYGSEGMNRRALILSTLTKLKQICNHPAHFLQDNSDFSLERSYKFSRLFEMINEVIENEESLLIFSQYAEICEKLYFFLKENIRHPIYYLHGGTPRGKREKMISEFQDSDMAAGVFILSLKAGGVGITLTKANHVFHFDRWWNPAVENQASDRAFRIGQKKNVFVHKYICLGTLEEKIDEIIEDKKKLGDMIVGNDESWLTELDNEAFKDLIKLNKEALL